MVNIIIYTVARDGGSLVIRWRLLRRTPKGLRGTNPPSLTKIFMKKFHPKGGIFY